MARPKKKPLRGSVRQNTIDFEEDTPRFGFGMRLALMVLGAIALILVISWLWYSQWPRDLLHRAGNTAINVTRKAGFAVSDVTVEGRRYTDKTALYIALGVRAGGPVFAFDPQEAHDNVMKLPWTKNVTILRSLPNKIVVKLEEREPIARWQNQDKTIVIDSDGLELTEARAEEFTNLPLVVGNAAPEQTKPLLQLLRDHPVVARVLKAAVRVGERRWNFYLHPNLLIRLPEREPEKALTKLTQLIQEQKILDRNVVAVDLRFPDRMVIEPGTQPQQPDYGDTQE